MNSNILTSNSLFDNFFKYHSDYQSIVIILLILVGVVLLLTTSEAIPLLNMKIRLYSFPLLSVMGILVVNRKAMTYFWNEILSKKDFLFFIYFAIFFSVIIFIFYFYFQNLVDFLRSKIFKRSWDYIFPIGSFSFIYLSYLLNQFFDHKSSILLAINLVFLFFILFLITVFISIISFRSKKQEQYFIDQKIEFSKKYSSKTRGYDFYDNVNIFLKYSTGNYRRYFSQEIIDILTEKFKLLDPKMKDAENQLDQRLNHILANYDSSLEKNVFYDIHSFLSSRNFEYVSYSYSNSNFDDEEIKNLSNKKSLTLSFFF